MTTMGKGRGWSRQSQEPALRKPGPPSRPRDEVIERIRDLDVSDVTSIETSSSAAQIVVNKGDLTNITKLYNEALEDRSFIPNLLAIFYHPSNHFSTFINVLQPDYERREELAMKSSSKFLNLVCLMGEILQRSSRFLGGRIYPVFTSAVINLCKTLLESSEEDEIEVVMNQIWLNGEKLNAQLPKQMAELMSQIREVLVSKNLSTRSRAMLLYAIEISHNNYVTSLNSDVEKFYESYLKKETIAELIELRNLAAASEATTLESKSTKFLNQEKQSPLNLNIRKSKQPEEELQKDPQPNAGRPRAIRGSGVNGGCDEERKNSKKTPFSDKSDVKKGWGHDDRFQRDY
ncbi:uncharacterized protein LOC135167083 [Diachasmimorpha longicaudata]|uniref:uncharacterized protein LOC135167083 n=1 Tax=Diachasmimorpha longicaudata TaxID=58733 RepID=UPI0030B8BBB2